MYICAKGKEIHLQEGENTMTKQEIEKILKEALNYLKNKKAYDENPCETVKTMSTTCFKRTEI